MTEPTLADVADFTARDLARRQRADCPCCDGELVGPMRDAQCLACLTRFTATRSSPRRDRRTCKPTPERREQHMSIDSIKAKLAAAANDGPGGNGGDGPPMWRGVTRDAQPGDEIAGIITSRLERESRIGDDGGTYTDLTVRDHDGGEHLVRCSRKVLAGFVADEDPREGDEIGVLYQGPQKSRSGSTFEQYAAVIERPAVSDVPADPPATTDAEPPREDDDIPF